MWKRRFLQGRRPNDDDIARELHDHLALEAEARVRDGADSRTAQDAAHRAFGNVTSIYEDTRAVWIARSLDHLAQDLSFAARMMRRTPVFTLIVVATLAVGIGANTAIFTFVDAILVKSLPVREPERLVVVDRIDPRNGHRWNISFPLFERLKQEKGAFAGVTAMRDGVSETDMVGPEAAASVEPVVLHLVSGEYFDVLGALPLLGRTLIPDDDRRPGGDGAVVLSHDFWMRRFGGDLNAVGARITLARQPMIVVGVARPGFFGEAVGRAPDVWAPLTLQPRFDGGRSLLDDPRVGWLRVMARLEDGVTSERATAALGLAVERMRAEDGSPNGAARYVGRLEASDGSQGLSAMREQFSRPLRVLGGLVVLVLFIVCTNVSGLLLARARAREHEMAVRLAIGAGRRRIVRQLLTEGVAYALVGALLGTLLAWAGSYLLIQLVSTDPLPVAIDVTPNLRTLTFTIAVAAGAVLLFGLAPALSASRIGAAAIARTTRRSGAAGSRLLVVAQIGMSLVLLVGAALFAMTLRNLRTLDLGFESDSLVQVRLDTAASGYTREQQPELLRRVAEHLASVPGVQAASPSQAAFGGGASLTCCIAIPGRTFDGSEDRELQTIGVGPEYFRTLRLPLLAGRAFTEADMAVDAGTPPRLAVVNETFARRYFGSRPAVGERFGWGDPPKVSYDITIVGVARDAVYGQLRAEVRPLIYFPQRFGNFLIVRASGAPERLAATLRRAIAAADPKLVVLGTRLVREDVERAVVREKLLARLSVVFGVTAAALTALGVYGLMAYRVEVRRREIGIRFALGALPSRVLAAELQSALGLALAGTAAGALAAPAAGALVASQLFGVSPANPVALAGAAVVLLLVTTVAALVPARRAAHIEPTVALRSE